MDKQFQRCAGSRASRWLTLILCLSLLNSSGPVAAHAGAIAPPVPTGRSELAELTSAVERGGDLVAPAAEPRASRSDTESATPSLDRGTVLGLVVNAEGNSPLAGVLVEASGVFDQPPNYRIYLPLVLKGANSGSIALPPPAVAANFAPDGGGVFTTTTTADGSFTLPVPAGAYTLTLTLANYTPDRRTATVRASQVTRVADVRLHTKDPVVVPIGSQGGKVTNSLANTSLEFLPGAVSSTQQARVTYLSNATLPGSFADGSVPMGFASLEPEGLVFPPGKEVIWTVAYAGTLPVGTDTLCYWWDGTQNRWRDPVPGKVVDLGGGKRGCRRQCITSRRTATRCPQSRA